MIFPTPAHAATLSCDKGNLHGDLYLKTNNQKLFKDFPTALYACSFPNFSNGYPDGTSSLTFYDDNDNTVGSKDSTANSNLNPAPLMCDGGASIFSRGFAECLVRVALTSIGQAFMWIGIQILSITGSFFEFAIRVTVKDSGSILNSSFLKNPIEVSWSLFRDVANIVIIAMFVFTAISLILGISEYGDKRRIARVLVVAILLNFSLLFTKMIIDFSNFTAFQFYSSILKLPSSNQTPSGQQNANFSQASISSSGLTERFMILLGVNGVANSYAALSTLADAYQSGLAALAIGFLGGVLLLFAASIFAFGSFLLLSRVLLFLLLAITSALAFASWLIPGKFVEVGWSAWWKALFSNAIFAPLLMIFLWVSLKVSEGLVKYNGTGGGSGVPAQGAAAAAPITGTSGVPGLAPGTIGGLISAGPNEQNLFALLAFVMIIGMLYASFRFASLISGKAASFGLPGLLGAGLTAGLAAPLLRNTLGRGAFALQQRQIQQASATRNEAGDLRRNAKNLRAAGLTGLADQAIEEARKKQAEAARRFQGAQRFNPLTKNTFNALDTRVGKVLDDRLKKALGFSAASGKDVGGFAQNQEKRDKERLKAAEEAAANAKVTKEDKEQLGKTITSEISKQREPEREILRGAVDAEKARADALKAPFAEALKGAQTERASAQQQHDKEMQKIEAQVAEKVKNDGESQKQQEIIKENSKQMQELVRNGKAATPEFEAARQRIQQAQREAQDRRAVIRGESVESNPELRRLSDKLKQASDTVAANQREIDNLEKPVKEAEKKLKGFDDKTVALAKAATDEAVDGLHEAVVGVAQEVGRSQRDALTVAIDATLKSVVGKETRGTEKMMSDIETSFGKGKPKSKESQVLDLLKQINKDQAGQETDTSKTG